MAAAVATLLQATTTHLPSSSATSSCKKLTSFSISQYPTSLTLPFSSPLTRLGSESHRSKGFAVTCLPSTPKSFFATSTKLYVSGLSFCTTEENLQNAFQNFGQLVEVNLVLDRIVNRPRGFAFLRYATEEESKKAIKGMHGKSHLC